MSIKTHTYVYIAIRTTNADKSNFLFISTWTIFRILWICYSYYVQYIKMLDISGTDKLVTSNLVNIKIQKILHFEEEIVHSFGDL